MPCLPEFPLNSRVEFGANRICEYESRNRAAPSTALLFMNSREPLTTVRLLTSYIIINIIKNEDFLAIQLNELIKITAKVAIT